jgi:hypothetical protein
MSASDTNFWMGMLIGFCVGATAMWLLWLWDRANRDDLSVTKLPVNEGYDDWTTGNYTVIETPEVDRPLKFKKPARRRTKPKNTR